MITNSYEYLIFPSPNLKTKQNKTISNISIDMPEIASIIDDTLKEKRLALPSRAPSSIDVQSRRSEGSIHSGSL
jgi:hypothetical protein